MDRIVRERPVGIAMHKKGTQDKHFLHPKTVDAARE
jgi:hypothetical protein